MKNGLTGGAVLSALVLSVPLVAVGILGPQNQDQLIVTAFVFYPVTSIILYSSWLLSHWAGVRMTEYDVILHKPGLLPKRINIPIKAIKSIRIDKRTIPNEYGESYTYKVSACLRDGRQVSCGELPWTTVTLENLREIVEAAKMYKGGNGPYLIETKVQILPILVFWGLVAAGAAYYFLLCSRMAA